jgi:acetyl esterase/lipase
VIIVVHGGSWVTGTKDSVEVMPIIRALWKAGFVVFSVNYRLLSDGGTFPRNVEDVKRAVAYLERSGKNYGADPARIGVVGVSAGAYLALMAAYSPYIPAKFAGHQIHLKACAALCPATDLTKLQLPVLHQYLNDPEEDYLDQLRSASPITYARNAIPTLLEHGTSDRVIPFGPSIDMVKALKSSGVKVQDTTL